MRCRVRSPGRRFGEANGARSAQEMRARIARYRRADPNDRSDFEIGCRILTQPSSSRKRDWIPVPPSWSPNIVSFKTYNTGDAEGLALWDAVNDRLNRPRVCGHGRGSMRASASRNSFGRALGKAHSVCCDGYLQRRCAITQERTLPASKLRISVPMAMAARTRHETGSSLRRDIHSLFDAGYVTVTPDLHFEVSRRIKEEFENGRHYYALHGQPIMCRRTFARPDPER